MDDELPRIHSVTVSLPFSLGLTLTTGPAVSESGSMTVQGPLSATVNLAGWIATGGQLLAPLAAPQLFATAHVAEYGTSVAWGDDDDWMIDAEHLRLLAEEQKPIDVVEWQALSKLSNQEAAELLGVSLRAWNGYKAAPEKVPAPVGIALRAALRDPLIMQAHYRPRKAGRPRKEAVA